MLIQRNDVESTLNQYRSNVACTKDMVPNNIKLNIQVARVHAYDVCPTVPVPGRPTISITVGQGPTSLAVGAGGGCLDSFTLIYPFSLFSLFPLFGRRPDID